MNVIQIPLTNEPNQTFSVNLPLTDTNIQLDFALTWNRIAGYWQISIAQGGTNLITALPVLNGTEQYTDLLCQFAYLNIGSLLVVPLSSTASDSPGIDDWDSNFALYWVSP